MYTHFRTEFVRRSQATIVRRVTMTQFMFIIIALVLGNGLFGLPWWAAPFLIAAAYVAGYDLRGELVARRLLTYVTVHARQLAGMPRTANVEAAWEALRVRD